MHHVQGISAASVIHVVAPIVGHEAVVGGVVRAAKTQGRPHVIALAGMVVNDVENYLQARRVKPLHHLLEFGHLLAQNAAARVGGMGREIANRIVAPVVRQPFLLQMLVVDEMVNGQQLDGSHSELFEVFDGEVACQCPA